MGSACPCLGCRQGQAVCEPLGLGFAGRKGVSAHPKAVGSRCRPVRASAVAGPPGLLLCAHHLAVHFHFADKRRRPRAGSKLPTEAQPIHGDHPTAVQAVPEGARNPGIHFSIAPGPSVPSVTSNSEIPRHFAQNISPQSPDFIPYFQQKRKNSSSCSRAWRLFPRLLPRGPAFPVLAPVHRQK